MSATFGTITSLYQVEQAVLSTLQTPPPGGTGPLLIYYLAEVERQNNLAAQTLPVPPGPSSYRGGVDASTMMAEWFPMVTVVAQPVGAPNYLDRYTVGQTYRVMLHATVGDDNEDTARMIADHYGAALAKLLIDFGNLGGVATNTRMTASPSTALLDAQARQVLRSTVTFETMIAPAFTVQTPETWPASPYTVPTAWPTVQAVDVTVSATAPSG